MTTSSILKATSPAKINLFLHITGRRPDGYHLLESIFCPIDLSDEVCLKLEPLNPQKTERLRIQRTGPLADLPENVDLTARACRAFFAAASQLHPHAITLNVNKRIPAQAGLGGGSSNAATVLRLLQNHFDQPLLPEELTRIGLSLGADVPFFLQDQPAFIEGVGEQITPLEGGFGPLPIPLLVYKPPQNCPTAQIFRAEQLTRDSSPVKIAVFDSWQREFGLQNSSVLGQKNPQTGFWESLNKLTENSLQAVVRQLSPGWFEQFQVFSETAKRHNAKLVRMTGSGSAMFAVFGTKEECCNMQANVETQLRAVPNSLFQSQIIHHDTNESNRG